MERFLPSSESLHSSTDEELERLYTTAVEWANEQHNVVNSVNSAVAQATFIREELHRRAIERSGMRVERLTLAITALTIVNVILVAVSLLSW